MKQEPLPNKKGVSFFLLEQGKSPVWSFSSHKDATAGIMYNLSPFGGKLLLPKGSIESAKTITLSITNSYGLKLEMIKASTLWIKSNPVSNYEDIGCQVINPSNQLKLALMELIRATLASNKKMYFRCEVNLPSNLHSQIG